MLAENADPTYEKAEYIPTISLSSLLPFPLGSCFMFSSRISLVIQISSSCDGGLSSYHLPYKAINIKQPHPNSQNWQDKSTMYVVLRNYRDKQQQASISIILPIR